MRMCKYAGIAAFILAGGASSRMGRDKCLIKFAGEPLIVHTALLLKPLVSSISLIGPPKLYRRFGLHTVSDSVPGARRTPKYQGPLAGIVTALSVTLSHWNLILASDLPYLSEDWIDGLLARALRSKAQAFVPRNLRGLEPLAAVYRRDSYDLLAEAFRGGVRKVTDALARISVETVALEDLGAFERNDLVLKNMNTPRDFEAARAWWNARELHAKDNLRNSKQRPSVLRVFRQNK